MTIRLLNCFTCNARLGNLITGMVCLRVETDKGLTLVDTGLGLGDYANPTWMTRLFRVISQMPFDPNEAAVNRVQALAYKPEDIQHILLTHMHFDHISGLPDFPHAKVPVQKREFDAFTDGKIRIGMNLPTSRAILPMHLSSSFMRLPTQIGSTSPPHACPLSRKFTSSPSMVTPVGNAVSSSKPLSAGSFMPLIQARSIIMNHLTG